MTVQSAAYAVANRLHGLVIDDDVRQWVAEGTFQCPQCFSENINCGCYSAMDILDDLEVDQAEFKQAFRFARRGYNPLTSSVMFEGKFVASRKVQANPDSEIVFALLERYPVSAIGFRAVALPEVEQIILRGLATKLC
jgi:hypothetical protein